MRPTLAPSERSASCHSFSFAANAIARGTRA